MITLDLSANLGISSNEASLGLTNSSAVTSSGKAEFVNAMNQTQNGEAIAVQTNGKSLPISNNVSLEDFNGNDAMANVQNVVSETVENSEYVLNDFYDLSSDDEVIELTSSDFELCQDIVDANDSLLNANLIDDIEIDAQVFAKVNADALENTSLPKSADNELKESDYNLADSQNLDASLNNDTDNEILIKNDIQFQSIKDNVNANVVNDNLSATINKNTKVTTDANTISDTLYALDDDLSLPESETINYALHDTEEDTNNIAQATSTNTDTEALEVKASLNAENLAVNDKNISQNLPNTNQVNVSVNENLSDISVTQDSNNVRVDVASLTNNDTLSQDEIVTSNNSNTQSNNELSKNSVLSATAKANQKLNTTKENVKLSDNEAKIFAQAKEAGVKVVSSSGNATNNSEALKMTSLVIGDTLSMLVKMQNAVREAKSTNSTANSILSSVLQNSESSGEDFSLSLSMDALNLTENSNLSELNLADTLNLNANNITTNTANVAHDLFGGITNNDTQANILAGSSESASSVVNNLNAEDGILTSENKENNGMGRIQLFENNPEKNAKDIHDKVMKMAARNLRQVELELYPKNLGKLKIAINVDELNKTSVSFTVSNMAAKNMIQDSMPKLKDFLSMAGFSLTEQSVSEEHADNNQQSSSYQRAEDNWQEELSKRATKFTANDDWLNSMKDLESSSDFLINKLSELKVAS